MSDLLLISSSRSCGTGYLEHCRAALAAHLAGLDAVLFVPYALRAHDAYGARVQAAFAPLQIRVDLLSRASDPAAAIERAGALFVGGGNTFRLLRTLQQLQVLPLIRARVAAGELRYSSASAGTNLACPTIRTTNDMPIVEPDSLAALGLIPFQINPHYQDPDPHSTHQGETREQRLTEYLEENAVPVLGLREASWIVGTARELRLGGPAPARLFVAGQPPRELPPGSLLSGPTAAV